MSSVPGLRPDLPPLKIASALKGKGGHGVSGNIVASEKGEILLRPTADDGDSDPIKLGGGGIAIVDSRAQSSNGGSNASVSAMYSTISTDDTEPLSEDVASEVQILTNSMMTIQSHSSIEGSDIVEKKSR